jgi:hypothetical protein
MEVSFLLPTTSSNQSLTSHYIPQITSSSSKAAHAIAKPGMNARSVLPSQQRLARIEASLGWEAEAAEQIAVQDLLSSRNKTLSPTGLVESAMDSDPSESVSTLSAEFSDPDDNFQEDEESAGMKLRGKMIQDGSRMKAEPTQEEEAEMRRTVQALFELEEALLNQHMSNIQVR